MLARGAFSGAVKCVTLSRSVTLRPRESGTNETMEGNGDIRTQKRMLRRSLRPLLATLDAAAREKEGAWVSRKLLAEPTVLQASTVLAYWAMPSELPVGAFIEAWRSAGKRIALPVVEGDDLTLFEYTGLNCLKEVPPFGILEPRGTPSIAPEAIDVVVVPGMAFDALGGRLGHGKGFYDRLFPRTPDAKLIGVCLSCQLVDRVPMEPHDRRVDLVIAQPSSL